MQYQCIRYREIDSTNRVAKELVAQGSIEGDTVLVAECQSAGRGQHGRTFGSPVGGLYCSIVLTPDLPLESLPLITLATGVACQHLLGASYALETFIKWPNDIILQGKKLAGILCETVVHSQLPAPQATVIIGIGLNVRTPISDYAPELQPILTTMAEHFDGMIDMDLLLDQVCQSVIKQVAALRQNQDQVLLQWQQADYLYNRPVFYLQDTQVITGIGQGLSSHGRYQIVEDSGEVHEILAGQVRLQAESR